MKKKTETKKNQESLNWVNDTFAVDHVNNYSDDLTFFNLHIKSSAGDVTIYGCKVISGSKGDFISFPSQKGSGDKYFNHAFVNLSDDISSAIIDAVSDQI